MQIADIFTDQPTLETDRFILRKLTLDDLEDVYAYASNDQVSRYVTWNTHHTLADTKEFIDFALHRYENSDVAPWGIELKEHNKIIGAIDFVWWKTAHQTAEIGYVLSEEYWGQGIMTEAANEVIKFGFNMMNLTRIQAQCFKDNIGSTRVMEKIGMTYEGMLRKSMFVKNKHQDLKMYSILASEYFSK